MTLRLLALLGSIAAVAAAPPPSVRNWKIDGEIRSAIVYAPTTAKTQPAPLLFVFHGHGGTAELSARRNAFQEAWPEALVVYPQGLRTPGVLTDPAGERTGWQMLPGGQADRDLHFFDAMLADLRRDYRIDPKQIFVTGHSNGGGFTYLLWAVRGDELTAVAPTAAAAPRLLGQLKPKPAYLLAGENDPLVKFRWQQHTITAVLKLNQSGPGQPWMPGAEWHPSPIGAPVVTFIHSGGHGYPGEATGQIVRFFHQVGGKSP